MGLRCWSLVGSKRWLLLRGSKCTMSIVIAIGVNYLVALERLVARPRGR